VFSYCIFNDLNAEISMPAAIEPKYYIADDK